MLARQLKLQQPKVTFKAPREWLPALRTLLDAYPQGDLASTEAMCCRLVGDFTAGIVLHRLLYWIPRGIRSDNAIWKSDREWYAELNLSYAQMQRVRARLAPVVKSWVEKAEGAPTHHYQLRVEALVQGVATVLNRSTVEIKLALLEKTENGISAKSKMDSRQTQESITNQHQGMDERSKIYHPYLKRFVGFTPEIAAKLIDQLTRLGEDAVREVLKRCEASTGRSWQYVLKALENAKPSHAPIPLYDSPPALTPRSEGEGAGGEGFITDDMRRAWASSDEGRAWAARLDAIQNPESTSAEEEKWNQVYRQLETQLGLDTFNEWLRDAHFLSCEAGTYHIGVYSPYARDTLQHRMYSEIQQWMKVITGETSEFSFEVHIPPHEKSRLNKLMDLKSEASEAEAAFYRSYKNG